MHARAALKNQSIAHADEKPTVIYHISVVTLVHATAGGVRSLILQELRELGRFVKCMFMIKQNLHAVWRLHRDICSTWYDLQKDFITCWHIQKVLDVQL